MNLDRVRSLGLLALLWLAGIDLRVTILALPPLLPAIHQDLALSEKLVGALSGLPVLLFGFVAVPGALLIGGLGTRRALIVALLLVSLGSAGRGLGPSVAMLFAMTFVMGAGVAIMQPALPALVSEWFPGRAAFATAVYANGLLVGETLSAALTLPVVLPAVGGSWRLSFLVWTFPAALAAVLFAWAPRSRIASASQSRLRWPDLRRPDTWRTGLILGGGSSIYFGANAFIPDFLTATGQPELIGPCLSALNLGQFPASFLLLLCPRHTVGRRAPLLSVALLAILSLGWFLLHHPWSPVLGSAILGFAAAFVLISSLASAPLLAPAGDVHRFSAGMFAIGYATAFLLPLLGGIAWDATGHPLAAFVPVVAGASLALGCARGLVRFEPRTLPAGDSC